MRRAQAIVGFVVLLMLLSSCGGDKAASPSESPGETTQATGEAETSVPKLTPLAEAQYADRAADATSVGETLGLRYYPENADGLDANQTEAIEVTVEQFELGAPPCGPNDGIFSMCDGSVTPVRVVARIDNPNDIPASIPELGVLSPDGTELTLYVCPGDAQPSVGSEMLPTTTVTITACFGSDTPLSSLSGWLAKANTVGIVPDEGGEAYWLHE